METQQRVRFVMMYVPPLLHVEHLFDKHRQLHLHQFAPETNIYQNPKPAPKVSFLVPEDRCMIPQSAKAEAPSKPNGSFGPAKITSSISKGLVTCAQGTTSQHTFWQKL